MIFRSIRFKVTILYMLILALTLLSFSAILYHYVAKSLYGNMDTLLRTKADGVAQAVSAYWATERVGTRRYGMAQEGIAQQEAIDFSTIAAKWVQEKSKDPTLLDIIVQIYDQAGSLVASSKNTQGITSVSGHNVVAVLEGKSCFDNLTSSFPTKKSLRLRVFIAPVVQDDKVAYIVQVASPLTAIESALNILKFTLFLLFPVTVLLTGMMGTLLAKATLHPVGSMIRTIHGITAETIRSAIPVPETNDEIQKLAETFNDMLRRLDKAFTSQKRLFQDLSHELKTPLTIMKGEFEVALKKARTQEEYAAIVKSSLEEVDKIAKLVDNLLILASFESKGILPERKEIDLNLLVQGAVNSIRKLAERKDVAVRFSQKEGLVVSGDEQQLKQLFLNLLDNAVKYTPSKGTVAVTLEAEKGMAKVAVTDTGIGIPEAELGKVFDRFYRADRSASRQGFGLGLSIVRSIVDAHKGTIEVVSRPAAGSTFAVRLPLFFSM